MIKNIRKKALFIFLAFTIVLTSIGPNIAYAN